MIPRVELVYDRDCPNVAEARRVLLEAFAKANVQTTWGEWDRSAPESPSFVRGYGSPTILVDRKDVAGAQAGEGADCCRLYDHELGGLRGVPSVERVAAALRCGQAVPPSDRLGGRPGWWSWLATAPGIFVALLPKLACPACWPAYAGLLSFLGLGFLLDTSYLLPVTAVFLLIAVGALAFRGKTRRGYGPFAAGVSAAIIIVVGKFLLHSEAALYFGIALLVGASLWNACPRKKIATGSCSRCAPQEPGFESESAHGR